MNDGIIEELRHAFQTALRRVAEEANDLTPEQLLWQPQQGANSIAFYLWHVPRTTDFYIRRRLQLQPELWVRDSWVRRIPVEAEGQGWGGWGIGTGFTDQQVGALPVLPAQIYVSYLAAVETMVDAWLSEQSPETLVLASVAEGLPMSGATPLAVLLHTYGHILTHRGEITFIKGLMGINGRI